MDEWGEERGTMRDESERDGRRDGRRAGSRRLTSERRDETKCDAERWMRAKECRGRKDVEKEREKTQTTATVHEERIERGKIR